MAMAMIRVLVTGEAGSSGRTCVNICCGPEGVLRVVDNLDDFYDPQLKHANLER